LAPDVSNPAQWSEWPREPHNKECRRKDVNKALAFGNRKGTSLLPNLFRKLVTTIASPCH
jgi:hypothetical protein